MLNLWIAALALVLLYGCGPQLRIPRAPQESVEAERQRQLAMQQDQEDLAFKRDFENRARLFSIYSRLRTHNAELCGDDVKPFWGIGIGDLNNFSTEVQNRAARVLKIDSELRVMFAGGPALLAGIREGDVIRRIGTQAIRPGSTWSKSTNVEAAVSALRGRGLNPIELELKRSGESFTTILTPVNACAYELEVTPDTKLNAAADGSRIFIHTGMIAFAETDDKIAAVLGHELAHNALKHIDTSRKNEAIGGIIGLVADIGLLAAGVNTQGAIGKMTAAQGRKAFSQDFEREADHLGLYFAARAGFDPSKAPDLWRTMGAGGKASIQESYSATHPSTPERAANLEESLREINGKMMHRTALIPDRLDGVAIKIASTAGETISPQLPVEKVVKLPEQKVSPEQTLRPETTQTLRRTATVYRLIKEGKNFVDSGITLTAEFTESGPGSGASRIYYPNQIAFVGQFWTTHEKSFSKNVRGRLVDPNDSKQYPAHEQLGFATYTDEGGGIMECAFAITSKAGSGIGSCLDNKGTRYRLVF